MSKLTSVAPTPPLRRAKSRIAKVHPAEIAGQKVHDTVEKTLSTVTGGVATGVIYAGKVAAKGGTYAFRFISGLVKGGPKCSA